jgi:hypothetical protein
LPAGKSLYTSPAHSSLDGSEAREDSDYSDIHRLFTPFVLNRCTIDGQMEFAESGPIWEGGYFYKKNFISLLRG